MNIHLFREPTKGFVAHTADTALLVQDSTLFDLVLTLTEVLRPASLRVTDAIEKWPGSEEPTNTGWQLAYGTEKLMYETIKEDVLKLKGSEILKGIEVLGYKLITETGELVRIDV